MFGLVVVEVGCDLLPTAPTQAAEYVAAEQKLVWTIKKFQGGQEFTCKYEPRRVPRRNIAPLASLSFQGSWQAELVEFISLARVAVVVVQAPVSLVQRY